MKKQRASGKEIFGWAMFDFANQGYTLLITTVIFPVLFTTVIVGDAQNDYRLGNFLWSLALAISYMLVVISGPVFGAIMDFSASKKRFLFASYALTVVSTGALYFVAPGYVLLGVILLVVSNFGYAVGENFIAAFLTDLGPPEDLGRISAFGWSMGYVGGLVSTGFVIAFLGEPTAANFARIRWVGPFTAVFFLVAAIPTFLWVRERVSAGVREAVPARGRWRFYVSIGFRRLGETVRDVGRFRDLAILLLSIFFSMAAIYIIITFAFIYGDQVIRWDPEVQVYMFVIVQITAALGAVIFGFIQDRIGAKQTYIATMVLWTVGIVLIYATPQLTAVLNVLFGRDWHPQRVFLFVGVITGVSLGSSQSAGRAMVGVFTPDGKSSEFFGFWGLSGKLAGVFGVIGLGILQAWFGLQVAILFCAVLFVISIVVALFVDQERGVRAVEEYTSR